MGVCWQTTGDSSKSKNGTSSRLTNSIIVASHPNNNNIPQSDHTTPADKHLHNIDDKHSINLTLFDQSYEDSLKKFPDMPEIEPRIMKGYGIKQMPGYKCNLKIDELNKKREEFWASKNKLNINKWKIIHQACIYDHINAEDFLYKNNIKTLKGCINNCLDEQGKLYRVPNYCINDPTFQLELLNNDNSKKEKINIFLNDVASQVKKNYKVFDDITGKELIGMYCDDENIDKNKFNFKLIFGGGIIKENETLFQHKVKNDYVIQICKFEI